MQHVLLYMHTHISHIPHLPMATGMCMPERAELWCSVACHIWLLLDIPQIRDQMEDVDVARWR
jgi:hypothetical protein